MDTADLGRQHDSSGLADLAGLVLTVHRPAKELRWEDKRSDTSAAAGAAGVAAGWSEKGSGRHEVQDNGCWAGREGCRYPIRDCTLLASLGLGEEQSC